MQDFQELGARLSLANPKRLFLSSSSDVDGEEIRQAIVKAYVKHHDGQLPISETQKLHVLEEAGRSLIRQEGLFESAIHLTRFADSTLSDTAELAHIRLHALRRLGRIEELLEDAERILQSSDVGSRPATMVRDNLRKWNMERRIPVDTKYLPAYFPDPKAALQRPFASALPDGPYHFADAVGPVIAALQGRDSEDLAFLQRVRWGAQVHLTCPPKLPSF